jgi:hypothetical protein
LRGGVFTHPDPINRGHPSLQACREGNTDSEYIPLSWLERGLRGEDPAGSVHYSGTHPQPLLLKREGVNCAKKQILIILFPSPIRRGDFGVRSRKEYISFKGYDILLLNL